MTQQIALVTGASSGIGKAIAEHLAAKGYYVFASARGMKKLEALRHQNIEPLQLDVTDSETIASAIEHIKATKGRIDALVNNAGYGLYGTVEGVTPERARHQFDVNVFGLAELTQAVLPIMRSQKSGVIVNMSSVVGKVSMPGLAWYCASKYAVEALSDALRSEVKPFGIKVVIIEPGPIKTGFAEKALETLNKTNDPPSYNQLVSSMEKLSERLSRYAPGPDIIAKAVHEAVTSDNPKTRYALPISSTLFIRLKRWLSDRLFDRTMMILYQHSQSKVLDYIKFI